MFVKTMDGNYVNLNLVRVIQVKVSQGKIVVLAQEEALRMAHKLYECDTREEADKFIQNLLNPPVRKTRKIRNEDK